MRRNVTEDLLRTQLDLTVEQLLELISDSVAPSVRAIHKRSQQRMQLSNEDLDALYKATRILSRIRSRKNEEEDETKDLSGLSDAELRKKLK